MILIRTRTLVATFMLGTCQLAMANSAAEEPSPATTLRSAPREVMNSRIRTAMAGAKLIREGHEAVIQAFDFHSAVVRLGERLFNPELTKFRDGQAYHPEFTLAADLDSKERRTRQFGTVADNEDVIDIIKEDLNAFIKSEEVGKEVDKFYAEWREVQYEFRDFAYILEDLAPLFALATPDTKRVAAADVERTMVTIRNSTKQVLNAEPAARRAAMLATIYVVVSIFHNNDSRIALAFDNPVIVNEIIAYVRENIGDNALLDFARQYAMPMDYALRFFGTWPYLTSALEWAKDHPMTVVGTAVIVAYFFMYGYDTPGTTFLEDDWNDFGDPPVATQGLPRTNSGASLSSVSSDGELMAVLRASGASGLRRSVSVGGAPASPPADHVVRSHSADLPFAAEFGAALGPLRFFGIDSSGATYTARQ